jgi:hypothetical protein
VGCVVAWRVCQADIILSRTALISLKIIVSLDFIIPNIFDESEDGPIYIVLKAEFTS